MIRTPPPGLRSGRRAGPRYLAAAAAAFIALIAVGACSGNTSGTDSTAPVAGAAPGMEDGKAQYSGNEGGAAAEPRKPGTDQQAPAKVEPQQRSLIYTGNISLRVDKVPAKADQAVDIAAGLGGVVGSDKRGMGGFQSQAVLVLRVPSDQFNRAMAELAKLGEEITRSVQTEDVTEQLVDLDSRLATQRASVDRVRALLARAQTIGEIVSLESELTRREADLDSLEKRKASVAGMVAMSTITVEIHGPDAQVAAPPMDEPGFLAGLRNGWSAFVNSVKVVLVVIGWLLPWLIAIGVPTWLILWFARRRSRGLSAGRAGRPGRP